jgi:hypothetical protein
MSIGAKGNAHVKRAHGAILATVLASAPIGGVLAQQDNPIDFCRETSTDKDARIACLESAITTLTGATASASQSADVAALGESAPQTASAAAPESSPEPTALASAEPADDAVTGLGAEQVERRLRRSDSPEERRDEKEQTTVTAGVTEYATSSLGKLILFLDNGQVWRQRSSDRNKIRLSNKRDYTVEISEGMISGYRIHINELNRTIVAERIQ